MSEDILTFIKSCIKKRKIIWTYHVNMRLEGRHISRESLLFSTDTYEIIEKYPGDKYLPSYLIYAEFEGKPLHLQVAVDKENNNVRIVTAYQPALDKWEKDFKTRKKK